MHVEGGYALNVLNRPVSLSLGYGRSSESLALNIPKQRYATTLAVTILENTIASLEYRYDKNYGRHDTATGKALTSCLILSLMSLASLIAPSSSRSLGLTITLTSLPA